MQLRKVLQRIGVAIATTFTAGALSGCAEKGDIESEVKESGYSVAFPLQQGGEQIDFLVRVENIKRPYQFNLVFVEPMHWPDERKEQLRRLRRGQLLQDPEIIAYPVKLRIRIDSVGKTRGRPAHIDEAVSDRSPLYSQNKSDSIWRVLSIYVAKFQPGVYRIRVDNLAPAPQLDFETRFLFERDNRKY